MGQWCGVWGHIINPLARHNLKTWSMMAGNLDHLNKLSSFYLLLTRYFGTSLQEMAWKCGRVERAGQIRIIHPLETYFNVIFIFLWKQMIADATFVSYWNKSLLAMKYLSDIMISEKSQMGKVWLFSVLRISRLKGLFHLDEISFFLE